MGEESLTGLSGSIRSTEIGDVIEPSVVQCLC